MAHPIPEAAIDKHVALLGMTGAGKTSVIKTAIVEPDLEAGRRVLIITPKDDWWGLRLSKTGRSKGFDIPIFGGRHADYPLQVKDAALIAEAYGTMKGSAIFCTSLLSGQDRAHWFADFAERLLMKNRGWLRVVIDEAHVFMPKQGAKGGGKVPMALHAGNELVSQGRSGGLRIVLASQRSAKLHNDSLTQCSCLMAMLLMAPHDRDAVKDWIEDQADPVRGKEIIASLASLSPGQAWVWAPGAKFLECVQFARPSTFDSSAAPDDGTDAEHRLAPINLDALKGKLATVEAERIANDPKALKAELAKLRRELAAKPVAGIPTADPKAVEDAYQNGVAEGLARGESRAKAALAAVESRLKDALAVAGASIEGLDSPMPAALPRRQVTAPPVRAARHTPTPKTNGHGEPLPKGERACLIAISQYPNGVRREQLTVLTGYKRSSRDAYIQRLRERGHIEQAGERIIATQSGVDALGHDFDPLPTGEALQERVLGDLPEGERRVLEVLIARYPETVDREDIDEQTGYKRSSRDAYLQRLGARELVVGGRGSVRASEDLFG